MSWLGHTRVVSVSLTLSLPDFPHLCGHLSLERALGGFPTSCRLVSYQEQEIKKYPRSSVRCPWHCPGPQAGRSPHPISGLCGRLGTWIRGRTRAGCHLPPLEGAGAPLRRLAAGGMPGPPVALKAILKDLWQQLLKAPQFP